MVEDSHHQHYKIKKSKVIILILVIASSLALIISLVILVHDYRYMRRAGAFSSLRHPRQLFFGRGAPDFAQRRQFETNLIRDWMTFSFINHAYGLPSEYLQSQLNISDKKYPDVTINSWAKQSQQDAIKIIKGIQTLIRDYHQTSSSPSPNLNSPSANI